MTASAEPASPPQESRGIWIGAILCMAALAIAYLWFPLVRINTFQQVNYNEGWNSYRQQMAAQQLLLYALPPDYAVTNYPPLSFHAIGLLGKLTGDVTAAGRWIALLSLAAIGVLAALIVRHSSAQWRLGIYAGILFVTWLAALTPDRVGVNDPHLFGMVFSMLGLYLYVRGPESTAWLCGAALAFVAGLFIKQSLIAFPAAVAIHMLLTRAYRRLAIWTCVSAVLAGAFFLLSLRDGAYFWQHLMTSRRYSFMYGWTNNILPFLLKYQVALALGVYWSIWTGKSHPRGVLVIALAVSTGVGFWFAGGDGVDKNVLFELLVMLAIVTSLAIGDLQPIVRGMRYGRALLPVLLAGPFLGCLTIIPTQFVNDRYALQLMPQLDADVGQAAELLKSRPGPALCENLLLCFEADKPLLYDAFYVDSQIGVGRIAERDVVGMIESGQFRTIELDTVPNEVLRPAPRLRFTGPIMRAIAERYKLKMQSAFFSILVPKDEP